MCIPDGVLRWRYAPVVLHRQRVHLVETISYRFRQPYHTAEKMEPTEGHEFISSVQAMARNLAYRSVRGLQGELKKCGYDLECSALLPASGRPLPEVEKFLRRTLYTADGDLFREALTRASIRCGLQVVSVKEKELAGEAAQSFGLTETAVVKRITEVGGRWACRGRRTKSTRRWLHGWR